MNKQEAIEKIKDLYNFVMEDGPFEIDLINKGHVIDIVSQIAEPQKPVVPKFVAEWIEEIKETTDDLSWIWSVYPAEHKTKKWLEQNTEKFMRAWLDGYEVEQEKLYTVEIPNKNINTHTILQKVDKRLVLMVVTNARWRGWAESKLTEAEIKQDFDFLWQFAKEVE